MKKMTKLERLRKEKGLTMRALGKMARVSASTIWNLENGYHEQVAFELKERIAHSLQKNVWSVFPDVEKEHLEFFRKKDVLDLIDESLIRLAMLKTFSPELKTKKEHDEFFKQVLVRMDLDELGMLYESWMTMKKAIELLKKAAKKYGIEIPKDLKG
jgi:transcriptional regulator with XRE-family HTH domain